MASGIRGVRRAGEARALLLLAALVCLPAAARAEEVVAVLPVDRGPLAAGPGSPATAEQLDLAAVRRRVDAQVLAPAEVRASLARAAARSGALVLARRLVEETEQASLHMQRGRALRAATSAIERLTAVAGHYAAPVLYARAQVAIGLAYLLRPQNPAAAGGAFAAALAADPALRPDRQRMSSRARELFAEARTTRATPEPPDVRLFSQVARATGARYVAWLAAAQPSPSPVRIVIYDSRARAVRLGMTQPPELAQPTAGRWTSALLAGLRTVGLVGAPARGLTRPVHRAQRHRPRRRRRAARPWYRRWWVWAVVGGAAVGTGVAIAVAASGGSNDAERYSFEFRF